MSVGKQSHFHTVIIMGGERININLNHGQGTITKKNFFYSFFYDILIDITSIYTIHVVGFFIIYFS